MHNLPDSFECALVHSITNFFHERGHCRRPHPKVARGLKVEISHECSTFTTQHIYSHPAQDSRSSLFRVGEIFQPLCLFPARFETSSSLLMQFVRRHSARFISHAECAAILNFRCTCIMWVKHTTTHTHLLDFRLVVVILKLKTKRSARILTFNFFSTPLPA